ncbi:hypothetical protein [Nonomuraea soli]|uniref:Peptidoglycan-binding protein n=1 Tax=Nonomuraea soli TaxID=1032476 RepID=A0A7W0CT90_9ACTN|nr:hypothetical protein [Nonomuraea soli]MBA2896759.1 hypothetical protein [Nonomuraea soli]
MRKALALTAITSTLLTAGTVLATPASASGCRLDHNRIEYPSDPAVARKQNRFFCRYGIIDASGGLTRKGVAWLGLVNGHTPAARTELTAHGQLLAYRRLGLYDPNKIEYADDSLIASRQFKKWFAKGYIKPDGGWTKRGQAQSRKA